MIRSSPYHSGSRTLLGCILVVSSPSLAAQDKAAAQDTAAAAPAAGPRRTPDVHFVPTEMGMVHAMLRVAKVGKNDVVYDLGCGDGRIVITAVKSYRAKRGMCVDIDPARIKESKLKADSAGVARKITFREGDLFEMDLREATVVTLYLLPALNERLRPKLFRELRPGSRVVSNSFDMGDWKADSTLQASPRSALYNFAYYWMIPADVAGTWNLTLGSGEAATRYTLNLEQRYQHVTGTASAGARKISLDEISLKGDQIKLVISDSLGGQATTMRFTGQVTEERAEGRVKGFRGAKSWTAERTERGPRAEIGR
jgi:SAM-dependent methyltransferase